MQEQAPWQPALVQLDQPDRLVRALKDRQDLPEPLGPLALPDLQELLDLLVGEHSRQSGTMKLTWWSPGLELAD